MVTVAVTVVFSDVFRHRIIHNIAFKCDGSCNSNRKCIANCSDKNTVAYCSIIHWGTVGCSAMTLVGKTRRRLLLSEKNQ